MDSDRTGDPRRPGLRAVSRPRPKTSILVPVHTLRGRPSATIGAGGRPRQIPATGGAVGRLALATDRPADSLDPDPAWAAAGTTMRTRASAKRNPRPRDLRDECAHTDRPVQEVGRENTSRLSMPFLPCRLREPCSHEPHGPASGPTLTSPFGEAPPSRRSIRTGGLRRRRAVNPKRCRHLLSRKHRVPTVPSNRECADRARRQRTDFRLRPYASEEDLEGELWRTATLNQIERPVQIDSRVGGEDRCILRLETRTAQLLKSPAEDLRDRLFGNRRLLDDRGVHGRPVSPEPAPRASGRTPRSPSDFPHVGNTRSRRSAGLHAQLPAKQRGDAVGVCKGKGGLAVDDGDTGSRFECTQCSAVRE